MLKFKINYLVKGALTVVIDSIFDGNSFQKQIAIYHICIQYVITDSRFIFGATLNDHCY